MGTSDTSNSIKGTLDGLAVQARDIGHLVSTSERRQPTLAILLRLADRTDTSVAQVASRLRELGAPVPDLRATIRAALRRVPMADPDA